MSTQTALQSYDQVFDGQRHYRTLLQCTARPGTIGQLDDAALEIPAPLNRATGLLALALLSADCSYCLHESSAAAAQFIERATLARKANTYTADFVLLTDVKQIDNLHTAKLGSLSYPEQGATIVFQVAALSPAPLRESLRLTLTGPGIESQSVVYVAGASQEFFAILGERNAEFPMGLDTYLTCDSLSVGPCVMALPRTTRVVAEPV